MMVISDIDSIYSNECFSLLQPLRFDYPGFMTWYSKLFDSRSGLASDRKILLYRYGDKLVGTAILKPSESKICTLFVAKPYRDLGIGKLLMCRSLEELETDTPLITVNDKHLHEYVDLFQYFGFKLEDVKRDYYKESDTEYVFNGELI